MVNELLCSCTIQILGFGNVNQDVAAPLRYGLLDDARFLDSVCRGYADPENPGDASDSIFRALHLFLGNGFCHGFGDKGFQLPDRQINQPCVVADDVTCYIINPQCNNPPCHPR